MLEFLAGHRGRKHPEGHGDLRADDRAEPDGGEYPGDGGVARQIAGVVGDIRTEGDLPGSRERHRQQKLAQREMPLRQQGGHVVSGKQPGEHVGKGDHADDARDSPEPMNDPIAEYRHDHDEAGEDDDPDGVIDIEQPPDCLPREHAAAGGKADVHEAHRDDRYDRAVDAELHAAGDHLREPKLRPLRRMQRHHRAADQLTEKERDQGPEHVAAEHHGERSGDDGGDLQIGRQPQRELARQATVPLGLRNEVDRADLDRGGQRGGRVCNRHRSILPQGRRGRHAWPPGASGHHLPVGMIGTMSLSSDEMFPKQLPPLLALAAQLLGARRPADALVPLREAALLSPADAAIQHDLGLACLEVGLAEEAIVALRRAIASNPRYADAYFRLGIALEGQGDYRAAVAAYERATALQPTLTEAWFRAGALLYTMGHREAAIGCFRRAAAAAPKTGFARLGAARALLTEDRDAEAERALRQLLAHDPANALGQDLLGNLLAESGRFTEARECFVRAVALAPLMAGSYYDLVRCRPVTTQDADLIASMQAALATPGLDAAHRMRVQLALGKAADDLGDYGRAMQHFDAADALREGSVAFDSAAFDREVERLIERCGPALIARAPELGSSDATPVLIVGMPRSGTTLVEQIVSSHPEVSGAGELNFWNEHGAAWHRGSQTADTAPLLREAAVQYLRVLRS